ncbi:hypothetical protein [Nocardioides sp.]|uniref:hypothetical protein n=1 Tax=Nocardioides sp. TaxID=35761 RepID=UPI002EDA92C9
MRRTLGATLLVPILLAGCGDTSDGTGAPGDPGGNGSTAQGDPPAPTVTVVSATAAGGRVDDEVTVLDDDAAIAEYAGRFRGPLAGKVTRAAERADVAADSVLVAAVVAVGCDVPPDVRVAGTGRDARFVVAKVASPHQECFAPVTTVALAVVPQDGGE